MLTISSTKILIVEDDEYKIKAVELFLRNNVTALDLTVAKSVTSAVRFLDEGEVDFCVIDMTLPTFDYSKDIDGGTPRIFGGIELLRYIESECPAVRAVVLTGFSEFYKNDGDVLTLSQLTESLLDEFRDVLLNVLYYSGQDGEWKAALAAAIKRII
jgi:CheY-like chemotaxis protein